MTAESLTKRPRQGNKREADCAHWRALGDGLFPVWGGNFFLATSFFADDEHVYLTQLRRDVSCRRDRGRLAKRSNERVRGVRAEACVAAVVLRVATLATSAPDDGGRQRLRAARTRVYVAFRVRRGLSLVEGYRRSEC
jgi:hypothetical protein